MITNIRQRDALIVTDMQIDFLPGGALAISEGDKIIPLLNQYVEKFVEAKAKVFATRDWHPPNHMSFKSQGGPWPPHCIQGTRGADFHPNLKLPRDVEVISKATDPKKEAYSAFEGTDLEERLRESKVERVFIGGLATDYCVRSTALDALKLGFETFVLIDATRGIDETRGDVTRAIEEIKSKGAKLTTFPSLEKRRI